MKSQSPFINPTAEDQILKNDLCYARFDKYPVSKGHMLIIPFREFASYFEATQKEKEALFGI